MWSSIVKKAPPSKPPTSVKAPAPILGMVGECKSKKGISIAVIDTNAFIDGRQNLTNLAEKLVTIDDVLSEIRDSDSCRRLDFSLTPMDTIEPSSKYISKVIEFAKATGDLQALSRVDIKVIALTYMLEDQLHGTKHLREVPPPIQIVSVKRLAEKELPSWGSNVANLEEWEALETETEEVSNLTSKIIPLKDLNMNIIPCEHEGERKQRRYPPKKIEVKLEGKMVVEGKDASQGEYDDDDGDWRPAVSRSTQRKYLRRTAMWKDAQQEFQQDLELADKACAKVMATNDEEDMRLDEDSLKALQEGLEETNDGSSSYLSESSVACVTADYAMQNVILQMGLRLLAPGGMQIRQLKRWILQCHACHILTTPHPDKILNFCPNCGKGDTLRRVAVTIGENGTIISERKPRFSLRGTKFSIPVPKGGRDGITKNLILSEDQLPRKYLHPKTKKKASKPGDDYFISDDVFMNHHNDRKAPFQPPLTKTKAIFSGKRNPNDNHYSRSMH